MSQSVTDASLVPGTGRGSSFRGGRGITGIHKKKMMMKEMYPPRDGFYVSIETRVA